MDSIESIPFPIISEVDYSSFVQIFTGNSWCNVVIRQWNQTTHFDLIQIFFRFVSVNERDIDSSDQWLREWTNERKFSWKNKLEIDAGSNEKIRKGKLRKCRLTSKWKWKKKDRFNVNKKGLKENEMISFNEELLQMGNRQFIEYSRCSDIWVH